MCRQSVIDAVDVLLARLQRASDLGATVAINGTETDPVAEVMRLTGSRGCDLVIETSGTDIAAGQAVRMARKGGTIVMVGYGKTGNTTLPMSLALDKELRFETVFRYRHIYPMAIQAVADGRVDLEGIVSHTFAFDDIQQAMDASIADKATIVKAVVDLTH